MTFKIPIEKCIQVEYSDFPLKNYIIDSIDWNKIDLNNIPYKFIMYNKENIDWDHMSMVPMLQKTMEKYSDFLNWKIISKHQNMNKNFIKKHYEKLDKNELKQNIWK